MIDERAVVHPGAQIGENVSIGPFAIVEEKVVIGDGCIIEPHAIVRNHTTIGRDNHIFQFASVGEKPQYTGALGAALLAAGDPSPPPSLLALLDRS